MCDDAMQGNPCFLNKRQFTHNFVTLQKETSKMCLPLYCLRKYYATALIAFAIPTLQ